MKIEFQRKHFACKLQHGFTLVEIMLAITLSLILIAGVVQVYLSSKTSFNVQNELARVQENQRISVDFLQRDVRQAGFTSPGQPAIGLSNRLLVVNDDNPDPELNADSITIRYEAAADCLGTPLPAGVTVAINKYSVDQVNNQLLCEGNGNIGFPQPIADGVSDMQVLLGENVTQREASTYAEQTPSPDRYVNVNSLDNLNRVVAVRVALLVQSQQPIRTQNTREEFALLDAPTTITTDRLKRQVITTTIPLRNVRR